MCDKFLQVWELKGLTRREAREVNMIVRGWCLLDERTCARWSACLWCSEIIMLKKVRGVEMKANSGV